MSPSSVVPGAAKSAALPDVRERAVVRFAGDSGDGMQITGSRFTMETALAGSDLATFPDFPAEIRAPVGTTFGVSAFQIHFGSAEVATAGDELDVLVAMNPAALTTNIKDLRPGGTVIVETIFGWPGLSSLLLAGVRSRDYPTVQAVVLVIAVLTILINLAVDLVYGLLDPRIRYS
mgnify:CR=1 FL=1